MSKFIKTGKTTQGRSVPLLVALEEKDHRELSSTGTSTVEALDSGSVLINLVALGADVRIKFGTDPVASSTSCSYILPQGVTLQLELSEGYTEFAYQAISGSGILYVTEF